MNTFFKYFFISMVVAFFASVVTDVHGFKYVSDCLNAYSLFSFLILGIFAIIFGDHSKSPIFD